MTENAENPSFPGGAVRTVALTLRAIIHYAYSYYISLAEDVQSLFVNRSRPFI